MSDFGRTIAEAVNTIKQRKYFLLLAQIIFVAASFSTLHYLFFLQAFGSKILLVHPASFIPDVASTFFLHVIFGATLGRLLLEMGADNLLPTADIFFNLRSRKYLRRILFFRLALARNKQLRLFAGYTLGALFGIAIYLGYLFFLFFAIFLFASFIFEAAATIRKQLPKTRSLFRKTKELEEFTWRNVFKIIFSSAFIVDLFRMLATVILLSPYRILINKDSSRIALLAIVSVCAAGTLRGHLLINNFGFSLLSQGQTYIGTVISTSNQGILFFDRENEAAIFFPRGLYVVKSDP